MSVARVESRVVFELGLNHLGSPERARRMLDTLAAQGATHATLQVVTDPGLLTRSIVDAARLRPSCLSLETNLELIRHGTRTGLCMGVTVVERGHVGRLVEAGTAFLKLLSMDITLRPLIREVAAGGRPVYLATGTASVEEIALALMEARSASPGADVRLIHTAFPVDGHSHGLNLRNIPALAARFAVPVAYGHHATDHDALLAAAAVGAETIFVYVAETPSPKVLDGPHAVLCSDAAAVMCRIEAVRAMLGTEERVVSDREVGLARALRRSIVAARPIRWGQPIVEEDLTFKRPGSGLPPTELPRLIGGTADSSYAPDEDLRLPAELSAPV